MVACRHPRFLLAVAGLRLACQPSTAIEQTNYGPILGSGAERASTGIVELCDYSHIAASGVKSSDGVIATDKQELVLPVPGFAPIAFNLTSDLAQVHFTSVRFAFVDHPPAIISHETSYCYPKLREAAQDFVASTGIRSGMGCMNDAACVEEKVLT